MPSNSDKWIRSLKDNPAGKVVADPEGNRFEWDSQDDTSLLLKKLDNDALAIEKTDLFATPEQTAKGGAAEPASKPTSRPLKRGGRDSGGGFDPYDHSGKKRR